MSLGASFVNGDVAVFGHPSESLEELPREYIVRWQHAVIKDVLCIIQEQSARFAVVVLFYLASANWFTQPAKPCRPRM